MPNPVFGPKHSPLPADPGLAADVDLLERVRLGQVVAGAAELVIEQVDPPPDTGIATPTQQLNDLIDVRHMTWDPAGVDKLRETFFHLADAALAGGLKPKTWTTPRFRTGHDGTQCIATLQSRDLFWSLHVTVNLRVFIATGDIRP